MAITHQKLFTNPLQWIANKPLTPIFVFPTSSSSSLKNFNSHRLTLSTNRGRIKASFDYNNDNGVNATNGVYEYEKSLLGTGQQYHRPTEVPWKKELCNAVNLIGIVGTSIQLKQFSSGKVLAWCRLAVKKSVTDKTWINLTFWDELAYIASQHVEKGQQIHVFGRLVSDTVEGDDGKQQTYYKVVVQELNFVEKNPSSMASNEGDFNSNSNSMTTGRKQKNYSSNSIGSIEELWQAFFANPVDWWDNRKNKTNPKYPDFKHKDTGEALWVEGRYNPSWVKSQLSILDERMESFNQHKASSQSDSLLEDDFSPY